MQTKMRAGLVLAVMALIVLALGLTLALPLTVDVIGNLDWGPVVGGYLATILMASAYAAIGLYVSSRTDNQIVAFILGVVACFTLFIIGEQLVLITVPLVRTGIIAAGLLVAVFIWNEFFLAFNLTGNEAATLPVYMARFREQQGMFVAQLSAASTVVILPAVIFGWISQKSLVKGLTAGGVKG